jgi:hypothetical protein
MLGHNKTPAADPLPGAKATVDRLERALTKAESEASDARIAFDRQMHDFVARGIGKDGPSQEPQRAAVAKVESLRRLLVDARARVELLIREAEDAARAVAIRASGSEVATLSATAEAKLVQLETAVAVARQTETELLEVLFSARCGLMQPFPDAAVQKDAEWSRRLLRLRAIAIGEQHNFPLDSSLDVDSGNNLGPLRIGLYHRTAAHGVPS